MFYAVMTPAKASTLRALFACGLVALLALLISPHGADAALDTYGLGDGHEGAVTVSQASPLNHVAPLALAAAAGDSELATGAVRLGAAGSDQTTGSLAQTQFEVGRLVLIIQSAGLTPPPASGDQSPIDLSASDTGGWELARITTISGDPASGLEIGLDEPLERSYTATGAQVVAIPEFTSVTVEAGGDWQASAWDGASGGVTAFLATETVQVDGLIGADGAGFRGGVLYDLTEFGCTQLDGETGGGKGEGLVSGVYPGTSTSNASRGNLANGAGGGDCSNAGGGGGSNAGAGGRGGFSYDGSRDVGGIGGAKLTYSAIDHASFGGGGGAGDENNAHGGAGGAGGGFVLLRGGSLDGAGSISADGAPGDASVPDAAGDGAGGGGAGGVVSARFAGSASCSAITANGGAGGNEQSDTGEHGPGGGGGGGVVLVQSDGGTCAKSADNGVAGVVVNGGGGFHGAAPIATGDPDSTGSSEPPPPGPLAAPGLTIDAPADGAFVNSAVPTVSGTSEPLARIRIVIDAGTRDHVFAAPDGSWSWQPAAPLSDGMHSIQVRAIAYGIAGAAQSREFTVDTDPPEAPLVEGPASPTNATSAAIDFSAGAGTDFLECALDSAPPAACPSSPANVTSLADGTHTYTVTAYDLAGNSAQAAASWTVDTVAPDAPVVQSPADQAVVQDDAPEISGTAESDSIVRVYIDDVLDGQATATGGSWARTVAAPLPDAVHEVTASATDAAGNVSDRSAPSAFRIDAAIPTATIQSKPGPLVNTSSSTFNFTASEQATFTCSLDGSPPGPCSSPVLLLGLADGTHNFAVIARDVGGHDSLAATHTWKSDTTAPVVTVTQNSPPAGVSPIFTFSSNEAGTTYKCRINGAGSFSTCSSPFAAPALAIGAHSLELRAMDQAGNTASKTVAFAVSDPMSDPPLPGPGPQDPTCLGLGSEPGRAPQVAVTAVARSVRGRVAVTVKSDRSAILRLSIGAGSRSRSTHTSFIRAGRQSLDVAPVRRFRPGVKYALRVLSISPSGGKSVAVGVFERLKSGRLVIRATSDGPAGQTLQSALDCAPEKSAQKLRLSVKAAGAARSGSRSAKLVLRSSGWAAASVRVVTATGSSPAKAILVSPRGARRLTLRLPSGVGGAKGRAEVQIETMSLDGLRQSIKRRISLW